MSKPKRYDYLTAATGEQDDGAPLPTLAEARRALRKLARDAVMRAPSMMAHGLTVQVAADRIAKELVP